MNKNDLAREIALEEGISERMARRMVDAVFDRMKEHLGSGENVSIHGFGVFEIRDYRPRQGRDFQKKSDITVPSRRGVKFRASEILKKSIRNDEESTE